LWKFRNLSNSATDKHFRNFHMNCEACSVPPLNSNGFPLEDKV
jgi:hypothetical protein